MKLRQVLMITALSASAVASFAATQAEQHSHDEAQQETAQPTIVSTDDTSSQPASYEAPASADSAIPVVQ